MACHTVNMPFMALNLRDPVAVQAESSGHNKDSYPKWSIITFDFPALGDRPAVKLFWYDGGKRPDKELLEGKPMAASGCLVIGEKGKLYAPGRLLPRRRLYLLGGADHARGEARPNRPATSRNGSAPSRAASRPCRTSPTTPAA